jgi:cephalosporin hydroxylase
MSRIQQIFMNRCNSTSDINEHLPTLNTYASECNTIIECGVRGCNSSYAFAAALLNKPNAKLIQYDIVKHSEMDHFVNMCRSESIDVALRIESDITCNREKADLLFIDTWHVYGQLKRELEYWNAYISKYIIMHDTTVDEWEGESIRGNLNINSQIKTSGFTREEITRGLWPAISEFLMIHPEWEIHARYTNNNGLTILRRINYS